MCKKKTKHKTKALKEKRKVKLKKKTAQTQNIVNPYCMKPHRNRPDNLWFDHTSTIEECTPPQLFYM